MRSCCFLLLVVLVFILISLLFNTHLEMPRDCESLDEPLKGFIPTGESVDNISNRLLWVENEAAERRATDDEERIEIGWLSNAIRQMWIASKMKFWLYCGTEPTKVLKKLKITSEADKNYKYFSKYYFWYYARYPAKQPSNLPTRTAKGIMMARLTNYLENNLSPPQVFKELGLTGTFASAVEQPNYEYFRSYSSMWCDRQKKISKEMNNMPLIN